MKFKTILLCSFLIILISACTKEAGLGGSATIYGKVIAKNYNSTFTVLQETYPAQEEDVYIIYGDSRTFSDRTRTNYDGTYEFKYLQKGKYRIYVYSKDSTLITIAKLPIIKEVEISNSNQETKLDDIIIFK